jgi:dolichol-phosphate mannosyltransferase
VVTVRKSTDRESLFRRWGSSLFYWLINKLSSTQMIPKTTDFRLYDKKVILAFEKATERERLFRGIMDWMGFRRVMIEFKADAREHGEAGYSYAKLWALAINSITSFSLWPLRLTGYIGLFITGGSGLLLLWMMGNNLLANQALYTPLAIIVVVNTFLIGIVLMAVGLVALYIGAIHTEVINRPLYLIREKINFEGH